MDCSTTFLAIEGSGTAGGCWEVTNIMQGAVTSLGVVGVCWLRRVREDLSRQDQIQQYQTKSCLLWEKCVCVLWLCGCLTWFLDPSLGAPLQQGGVGSGGLGVRATRGQHSRPGQGAGPGRSDPRRLGGLGRHLGWSSLCIAQPACDERSEPIGRMQSSHLSPQASGLRVGLPVHLQEVSTQT